MLVERYGPNPNWQISTRGLSATRCLCIPLARRRRLAAGARRRAEPRNSRLVFVKPAQKGERSMRAAVSSPSPHCCSRRRGTLLDARHVFDHAPQRRLAPLSAGHRAEPAAAARRPARRLAVSAFSPACRAASSGTKAGALLGFCLARISLLLLMRVLTF